MVFHPLGNQGMFFMIKFKLNGKEVRGNEGQYVLEIAEKYGIKIPTLCHHAALEPAGMCRLCTVELFDGRRKKFVTACNYPIWEGMQIDTESKEVVDGRKLLVELLLSRCPQENVIVELAKEYGIEQPRFKIEDDDCILCGLCVRICEKMGASAISLTGRGINIKVDTPYQLQTDACIGCGACVSLCPTNHIKLEKIAKHEIKPIISEYEVGMAGRKPIYVPYAQAVPNTPVIDREMCVHFKTCGCKVCVEYCGTNAIDHTQKDEIIEIEVGAVILAPGFEAFDPSKLDNYNYQNHPNVITSLEFERILSASGPTSGHLVRISDKTPPQKIAWFQCVGSRDTNKCKNAYCSSVCCMYAIKEAVIAKEHAQGDLDCAIFYMDMRTHGKDFENFYNTAKDKHGVRFIRSRVHTIDPIADSDELMVKYLDEAGAAQTENFDLIVLSIGLEIPQKTKELAKKLGITLNNNSFCATDPFTPVKTSREGIFACGVFQSPKDIPQAVIDASAAAAEAGELLAETRNKNTKAREIITEIDLRGEPPRIGVFVCRCGSNISGVIDIQSTIESAKKLPYVEYVSDDLYACAQDSQEKLVSLIKSKNLNRIVMAACTPKTHEPLFQETIQNAGLNKYLFEMVNIRNQGSWVHQNEPELATKKANDLIRMAVAKAAFLHPLIEEVLTIDETAVVIGGGISGMTSALSLSNQGYEVHIIEKDKQLGGQANHLYQTADGQKVEAKLEQMKTNVENDQKVTIHLNSKIKNVEGFVGNFKTSILTNRKEEILNHGIAIIATGASENCPNEYEYGKDQRIITGQEFDKKLMREKSFFKSLNNAVFIQCVGSRNEDRPYCSRICCTHSIKSALELKKINSNTSVFILYRDIRSYGEHELLYQQAREIGVIFIRYALDNKPKVSLKNENLFVEINDHILNRPIEITTDLLTLASAIVPHQDKALANFFKVPVNSDGFYIEKHAKLGPSEFSTDGVYLCGMAHYPKPIDESISQSKAAASRAVSLLSAKTINTPGTIARVNQQECSNCGVCVSICPYSAPFFIDNIQPPKSSINPVLCKGCGLCVSSCRSGAINLGGFDNNQILAQIDALFDKSDSIFSEEF